MAVCLGMPALASAAVISVNTDLDGPPSNDGQCTLREAVTNALLNTQQGSADCAAGSGDDEIVFDSTYFETQRTISLASPLPFLSGNLILTGPGRAKLTIDGGSLRRIFVVSDADGTPNSSVSISDMTLANGIGDASGGGAIVNVENLSINRVRFEGHSAGPGVGGAIRNLQGSLTISQSGFLGNTAPASGSGVGAGGAIFIDAASTQVQITGSLFQGNTATMQGGAISGFSTPLTIEGTQFLQNESVTSEGGALAFYPGGPVTLVRSYFDGNAAAATGGAVQVYGLALTVDRSTLSYNTATRGSAIDAASSATLLLTQSTLSGNEALNGAGSVALNNSATADIRFTTFYGNVATTGGRAVQNNSSGTASLQASLLIAGETAVASCGGAGPFSSDAATLSQQGSCGGATVLGAVLAETISPLQLNGGLFPTHAPAQDSPAVDAAPNCLGLTVDQRGYPRPIDGDLDTVAACDPGAVEFQSIVVTTDQDVIANDGLCSIREAFNNAALNLRFYPDCAPGRGEDTIVFDLPVLPATIVLGSPLPQVTEALSIVGPGETNLTLSAGVFIAAPLSFADNNANVDRPILIQGLTLANGGSPAAGFIASTEALVVDRVTFRGNASTGNSAGGAITQINGSLKVTASTFADNQSSGVPSGGAILAQTTDSVDIASSTFDQNATAASGGGLSLLAAGDVSLQHSTFSGNTAGINGGAVFAQGATDIVANNLTLSRNSASSAGGALFVRTVNASLLAHNLTFVGNQAGSVQSVRVTDNASAEIGDSIFHDAGVAGSHCGSGGSASFVMTGTSLVDDASCGGVPATGSAAIRINTELLDNGGGTATHALLRGSPAIDAATDCASLSIDQRGIARGADGDIDGTGGCDIGAYELQPIVVNTTNDVFDSQDGLCSLREAIANANQDRRTFRSCARGLGADLILFDLPNPSVITMTGPMPNVSTSMTIDGPGRAQLTIDANGQSRHFLVSNGEPAIETSVVITDMTLINGVSGTGGSIRSYESLTLDLVDFIDNTANVEGGGALLVEAGSVVASRLNFIGNVADDGGSQGDGGAVYVRGGGSFSLNQGAFTGNRAKRIGGAVNLFNAAPSSLLRVGFNDNEATQPGGAVGVTGTSVLDASNLTFSENRSGIGGGLYVHTGTATVRHATFFRNVATNTGSSVRAASGATVTLSDSLMVRDGTSSAHCSVSASTLSLNGANLVDDDTCPGVAATASGDIGLDPVFQNNAGFSGTHALLADSPAIDAGLDCASLPTDQRGIARPQDGDLDGVATCDIGAVELRPIIVDTVADVADNGDGFCSLREAIANANSDTRQWATCVAGSGPDLIGFNLPPASTITLTGVLTGIQTRMEIRGPGRDQLTLDANAAGRHFVISNGAASLVAVSLNGMTLANASAVGAGGSILSLEELELRDLRFSNNVATTNPAGAVSINAGSARISGTEFAGNAATGPDSGRGGALRVAVNASADIVDSQFLGNSAATYGGAIAVDAGGQVTGTGLFFSANQAAQDGGAIDLDGAGALGGFSATRFTANTATQFGGGVSARNGAALSLARSTLDGNHADAVGGGASIRLNSTLDGENLTFSGNSAGNEGGGLYAGASATLVSLAGSTFYGNSAVNGGKAIRVASGNVGLVNSLLEDNGVAGNLCSGAGVSATAGTVADDASCAGATLGTSLNLGPLADNGFALAPSHGLLPWTDATDVAPDCAGLSIDQRGQPRPSGDGRCDAGAFEVQNLAPVAVDDAYVSAEVGNVLGPNIVVSDSDPDATGQLEVVRVEYLDVNGTPQTLDLAGLGFNPFTLHPGIEVFLRRDGVLAYNPGTTLLHLAPGQSEVTGFSYVLSDGFSRDTAAVSLTFNGVDTPPTLADDARTVAIDSGPASIDVLANDTDVDGGTNLVTAVDDPANGTTAIAGDGLSLTYQPDPGYCNEGGATDDFGYTVNGSASAVVRMRVNCGPAGIDLGIGIAGDAVAQPGEVVGYQILVRNTGDVDGTAAISVLFDARLLDVDWTCTATPGGACPGGTGDISTELALSAGGQIQFDVVATTPVPASNVPLLVSATVDAVADTDIDSSNNAATFETQTTLFFDGFEDNAP